MDIVLSPIDADRVCPLFLLLVGLSLLGMHVGAQRAQGQPTLVTDGFRDQISISYLGFDGIGNVGSPLGLCFGTETRHALGSDQAFCYDGSSLKQLSVGEFQSDIGDFVRFDGKIFFRAHGLDGRELFVYDGTSTQQVADIRPSSSGADPNDLVVYDDGGSSGADLYFSANDGSDRELWRYEGSGSPSQVTDINTSGYSNPRDLTIYNDGGSSGADLYFSADDGSDRELWRYESGASANQVADINASGSSRPSDFEVYDNGGFGGAGLYFAATTDTSGRELWVYDPIVGAVQVADVHSSGSSHPQELTAYNGDLYFSADGGSDGTELWVHRADGTTNQVADIHTAVATSSDPTGLAVYNDGSGSALYFTAKNLTSGHGFYEYDESGSPTRLADVDDEAVDPTVFDDGTGAQLYFFVDDHSGKYGLWSYDGSLKTVTVTDTRWGGPTEKIVFDGAIHFASDGKDDGYELWRSDGSTVQQVSDIHPGRDGSSPSEFAIYDDGSGADLYFSAVGPADGEELWRYDGFGTGQVLDLESGSNSSFPEELTVYDDGGSSGTDLYFAAGTVSGGTDLWRYENGSSATAVADIGASVVVDLTLYDDGGGSGPDLYFPAEDSNGEIELWRYESGSSGSKALDLNGTSSSSPAFLTVYDGLLYFAATTSSDGNELWGFNGSTSNRLTDVSGDLSPRDLTVYKGALYFSAENGSGRELWSYDPTDGSLTEVADIHPSGSSRPKDLIVYNNRLYFTARDGSTGREPYAWDGSTLHRVDVYAGRQSGGGVDPVVYDDGSGKKLYVTADDGTSGMELWSFDGNSAPLPVELASLDAVQSDDRTVKLTWTTASEANNAGFRVEHRRVGEGEKGRMGAWEKVGFVEGSGTTTAAQSYRWSEDHLTIGTHQFRLVQVDLDGTTTVHDPISVDVGMSGPVTMIAPAPNPVRHRATLSFAVKEVRETRIALYNVLGQRVRTLYRGTPTAGEAQTVDVRTDQLSSGVYFVRLHAGSNTRTERLTVIR